MSPTIERNFLFDGSLNPQRHSKRCYRRRGPTASRRRLSVTNPRGGGKETEKKKRMMMQGSPAAGASDDDDDDDSSSSDDDEDQSRWLADPPSLFKSSHQGKKRKRATCMYLVHL